MIDGFESPFGMELLAIVDWLLVQGHYEASVAGIREGLRQWPAGKEAAERKLRLFDDRAIGIALDRLKWETTNQLRPDGRTPVVIHGQNGRIQDSNSYGNDPNPPKDKAR